MRKKIFAVLLAVVLIAGGLGGLVYAQTANPEHLLAFDQPFRWADVDPDIDSVGAYEELTGHYNWNLHIHNNYSEQTVVDPTISIGELSPDFSPSVEFPVSLPSLGPGEKWVLINAISSTFSFPFTLGYDSSRTMEPLEIPPGGGVQTVTIKVKPVDARYTNNPYMRIEVSGDVIAGSNQEPTGAIPTVEEGQRVVWEFPNWGLGEEYTFSVQLQVENPSGVNLVHKPHVHMFVQTAGFLSEEPGDSTTIYDEILDENIAYSVAPDTWQWHRIIADCWAVEYKPLSQPLLEHQPMTGQKLVGQGFFGERYDEESNATFQVHTMFSFTNPDGVSEVTIDHVSILDRYGAALYEGPLLGDDGILKPHEVQAVELHDYLESGDLNPVTVEIFWTGSHQQGLPLTGWQLTTIGIQDAEGNLIEMTSSETQMVNMVQVLEPPKVLRLQSWLPLYHPLMQPLQNFAQAVQEGTGGSVQIELSQSPLGVGLAEAVKQGTVEMGLLPNGWLRDYSRVMDGGSLPFLYNDEDGLMAAVQGGVGYLLSQALMADNITALGWANLGLSHLFSNVSMLDETEDMAGLKIRVTGIQADAITEWGGIPVFIPPAEVYAALQSGDIHGAALPLHLYDELKLYEVAPYFCVDYAFAGLAALSINSDVWNSLDAETQRIITKAAGDYVVEMLATVKLVEAEALQRIIDYGVEVYTLTPEERAVWRAASQPVWDSWVAQVGSVGQEIIDIALKYNRLK